MAIASAASSARGFSDKGSGWSAIETHSAPVAATIPAVSPNGTPAATPASATPAATENPFSICGR